jgi:hypothetical protein
LVQFRRAVQLLLTKYILIEKDARHVSTGAVHGLDQSMADWVTTNREHDWHCVARHLRCLR